MCDDVYLPSLLSPGRHVRVLPLLHSRKWVKEQNRLGRGVETAGHREIPLRVINKELLLSPVPGSRSYVQSVLSKILKGVEFIYFNF